MKKKTCHVDPGFQAVQGKDLAPCRITTVNWGPWGLAPQVHKSILWIFLWRVPKKMVVQKIIHLFIELDGGTIYRKALYLMVKTVVSCRFSLKPTQ